MSAYELMQILQQFKLHLASILLVVVTLNNNHFLLRNFIACDICS